MEGVQRQKGAYDFESHYNNACSINSTYPLSAVKAHLSQGILDLNADRIKIDDWKPLLSTLRINKSLEFIVFTSSYIPPSADKKNKKDKISLKKIYKPAIASKEIKDELCKALQQCLVVTPALACLRLQGIAFRESNINYLAKGLSKNCSLSYICFAYCKIGDNGLQTIGRYIKNNMTLNAINLVDCNLTWKGADILAKIIKHQSLIRHNEAWKNSLRYRQPDLECMTGLRRITVNNNPLIGDHGAMLLAEALRDDLWLKALDMQICGISNFGAKAMCKMLQYNTTLVVLDVRENPLAEPSLIQDIIDHVNLNCKAQTKDNSEPEYEWISLPHPNSGNKPRKKKKIAKTLNKSHSRKTNIKINGMCYHLDSAHGSLNPRQEAAPVIPKPNRGMPWRTAMRAFKQKGCFSNHEELYDSEGNMEIIADSVPKSEMARTKFASDITDKENHPTKHTHLTARNCQENNHSSCIENEYKRLQIELEHVKRELTEERMARQESDKNVYKLSIDNNDMQREVMRLKKKLSLLEEENVLDSIENAFMQFHVFLDILRDAGFGQLISMAGIDSHSLSLFKVISSRGTLTSALETSPNMETFPLETENSEGSKLRKPTTATSHSGAQEERQINSDCNQCQSFRKNLKEDLQSQHTKTLNLNSTFQLSPNESINGRSKAPVQDPQSPQSNFKKKPSTVDKEKKIKETMLKNMGHTFPNGSHISHSPDLYLDSKVPAFTVETQTTNTELPQHDISLQKGFTRSQIIENLAQKVSLLKKENSDGKTSGNAKRIVKGVTGGYVNGSTNNGSISSGYINKGIVNDSYVNSGTVNGCTSPTDQTHVKRSNNGCNAVDEEVNQMWQNGDSKMQSFIRNTDEKKNDYFQDEDNEAVHYSVSESAICKNQNDPPSDFNFANEKSEDNYNCLTSPQSSGSSKLKLLESLIEEESDSSERNSYNGYSSDSFETFSSNNHCNHALVRSNSTPKSIPNLVNNNSCDTSPLRSFSDETF